MNKDTPQQPVPKEVHLTPEEIVGLVELEGKVEASFIHPVTGQKEVIKIDFEKSLERWMNFYDLYAIKLPENFAEVMRDIWDGNFMKIEEAIKSRGFNEILFVPGDLDLNELNRAMSVGYRDTQVSTISGWSPFASINKDKKPHLVLLHNTAKIQDAPFFVNPPTTFNNLPQEYKQSNFTLADWLIFQRSYFDSTGTHPDMYGSGTWLSGFLNHRQILGAYWSDVGAIALREFDRLESGNFGCRLSRSFT